MMKRNFLLPFSVVLLISFGISSYANTLPSPFKIIPQPQNVALLNGQGIQYGSLQYVVIKGDFKVPVMGAILSQLAFGKQTGKGTLTLILDKTMTSLPSEEGYLMTIAN